MTGFSFVCLIVFYISNFDLSFSTVKAGVTPNPEDRVSIKVFYESLCPFSRKFAIQELQPLMDSIEIESRIDLYLHPFGHAKVNFTNNKFSLTCQHGEAECYGNKLHACALFRLGTFKGMHFNNCLMSFDRSNKGSDDDAYDTCKMDLGPWTNNLIRVCANTLVGFVLNLYHGIETAIEHPKSVPHVLINGKHIEVNEGLETFKNSVCAAFTNPPTGCPKSA